MTLCLFLMLALPFYLLGQTHPAFRQIDANAGLPSNIVYYVLQDHQKYVWIFTDKGVCRYNGKSFKTFTTADGLPTNIIFEAQQDPKGRIWFNCFTGDLAYYERGKIHLHPMNKSVNKILDNEWMLSWVFVGDDIYFTKNSMVAKHPPIFKLTDSTLTHSSAKEFPNIRRFNDWVYFTKINNEYLFTGANTTPYFKNNNNYDTVLIRKIHDLPNNEALLSNQREFYLYKNQQLIDYFKIPDSIPNINCVYVDTEKRIWIGTSKGIYYFKDRTQLFSGKSFPNPLFESENISHMMQDVQGQYWLGTLQNGVLLMPSIDAETYTFPESRKNRITQIQINKHKLFFSNYDEDVFVLDTNLRLTELPVPKTIKRSGLIDFLLYNDLIITTTGYFYNLKTKKQQERRSYGKFLYQSPFDKNKIIEGSKDAFLFFSLDDLTMPIYRQKIGERVFACLESSPNFYWVGTFEGLFFLEADKQLVTKDSTFPAIEIKDIQQDSQQHIWIATYTQGVFIKNRQNKTLYHLNEQTGLVSNFVDVVYVENDTLVWLGTSKGVHGAVYNPTQKKYILKYFYNAQSGLPADEVLAVKRWGKRLAVGTYKGICLIDDARQQAAHSKPIPIYIEEVELKGQSVSIHYQALTFSQQNLTQYRYRLLPSDTNWTYTNNIAIEYGRLSPDDYIFEIQAKTPQNDWDINPTASYAFSIKPVFTQTIYFILLIGLTTGVVGYWLNKYLVRKELAQNQLENRILELRYSALLSQMNPHFTFNALNSILYLVTVNEKKIAKQSINTFASLMRQVLELSQQNIVPLKQELEIIENYLKLEQLRFGDKLHIQWEIENESLLWEYFVPPMLIQPLVENAIIHGLSPKSENAQLGIFISQHKGLLKLVIQDNGIGRKAAAQPNPYKTIPKKTSIGLKNLQERLDISKQIYGLIITYRIEDLENNLESGTKITLFIHPKV